MPSSTARARTVAAHRVAIACSCDETQRDANAHLRTTEQSLRSLDALRTHHIPPLTPDEVASSASIRAAPLPTSFAKAVWTARLDDRRRVRNVRIEVDEQVIRAAAARRATPSK